jgi:hypothetical protein
MGPTSGPIFRDGDDDPSPSSKQKTMPWMVLTLIHIQYSPTLFYLDIIGHIVQSRCTRFSISTTPTYPNYGLNSI